MSNFRPDTGGPRWSLVQALSSSRAAGREGRCRQMSLACVGRTCSVPTTRFAPARVACFPRLRCSGSRLLSRERALSCVPFPGLSRSGSGFQLFHKRADSVGPARTRLGLRFVPSPPEQLRPPGAFRELSPRVRRTSPSAPQFRGALVRCGCVCTRQLASGCHPPGGRLPSRISGGLWLETGSLFAVWWGCRLWGRVGPFPLPAASCLRWGMMGRSAAG